MAAGDAIQLDHQHLSTIAHGESPPSGSTPDVRLNDVRPNDVRFGVDTHLDLDREAIAHLDVHADIPMMASSQAFDPFAAHPSQDDPEVSAAFKRLDLVEVRLARIEKRLMEISLLIARNFSATLQTPLGVPDVLEPAAPHLVGSEEAISAAAPSASPAVPRQTRGKRDRDLDDALESFLNSLSPTANLTRQ